MAAGYGTRLRPITDNLPKCMVPIKGRPLLDWWFDLLRFHGVSQVLVNTHHLPEPVNNHIDRYNSLDTGLTAYTVFEETLLGSGGTVRANSAFIDRDDDFFICYADNLTNLNLTDLLRTHRKTNSLLTMALFRADIPKQCGIAVLDGKRRVVSFEEKPEIPKSDLANAGVYVAGKELFDVLPEGTPLDFGKDVLPGLIGKLSGYETTDYLLDIGTPENYKRAEEEWDHDHYENPYENQLYGRGNGFTGILRSPRRRRCQYGNQ